MYGPAVVASVAYIDPGNFATNITAGAQFGYALVWVIVLANAMAILVQYLSAKAGIATGRDLPELCREHMSRRVSFGLWIQAELVAMATDLAEFVGAAIGLNLLFGVPMARRRADHRRGGLRPARHGTTRLPPLRARDRGPVRHGVPGFRVQRHRGRCRQHGDRGRARADLRGHRQRDARGRHHRRDRDAPRDLPALGTDQEPGPLERRGLAAQAAALAAHRRRHRARRGRRDQPADPGAGGVAAARRRARRATTRSTSCTPNSAGSSAAAPRSRSPPRCWPRGCPRPASARTPVRSSCRASSSAGSRCSSGEA